MTSYALNEERVPLFSFAVSVMRALLIISLFGLLFLTSCGGKINTVVYRTDGMKVGEIQFEDDENSVILGNDNQPRGRIRGSLVRNDTGGKAGTIEERDGHIVIVDTNGADIGSLENDVDCYGKGQEKLGSISAKIDTEAAGAACLLLLLPKE